MRMETPAAQASDDVWTVQRILQWTTQFLQARGVESARLESELLLAHARGCPRIRLYTDFEAQVTADERSRMREMVQRRSRREPLSYIVGEREFYGRPYTVGPGVLIPRPETEILIDVTLEQLPTDSAALIADVGCGSGCIAATLALQRTACRLVATDVSAQALEFTRVNLTRHDLLSRVQLLQGDLLEPIAQVHDSLDGVVSNPPYIRDGDMAALAPEVAEYEPRDALIGGPDGLDVVRRLIEQSSGIIRPGGFIVLELDPPQAGEICQLLEANGFGQCRIRQDLNHQDRIVQAIRSE
jgi:release factor glutamine methyltransferase